MESRISYYMPTGNGRQLYLKIPLGDLSQRNTNEIWWWRDADQLGGTPSNCCTYVTFYEGGTATNIGPMNIDATDTYTVRIRRSGQNFTVWMSTDGNTWTTVATRSYVTPISSNQNVFISGANYAGSGYADYDYVSVQGPSSFVPVTPCRVVDTRNPTGLFGGPAVTPGSPRSFPIPSGSCGIPADALAYSFNVTAVPHGGLASLTIWPTGDPQPAATTLNAADGQIIANGAIVAAGSGSVSVAVTNTADVILAVNGYFIPNP